MANEKSKFTNKISPLIEGQVPDFVQADHPVFVDFVKDYFSFLEAGRLTLTQTINYISQETTTSAYILNSDGDRIVTEFGEGTTGQFVKGETVTGGTTGATATVLVEDSRNTYLYITGQQLFQTGETITGGTSGSSAAVVEYRANPVQNIQQMLEYADVDNTLYDFLDQMRDQFMAVIPETLASGISKRNLIKNIKDLYAAKGTSEGHKLFMRILLGETSEIFYPNTYMLRSSGGDWNQKTIMRVAAFSGVQGSEVENAIITGQSSGATAIVVNSLVTQQGTVSVTEFQLANIVGTFVDGEVVSGNSTTRDVEVSFTVDEIVASVTLGNDGILHTNLERTELESIGNSNAEIIIDGIAEGSVSDVIVDDVGSLYEVGDTVTFTAQSVDTNVNAATGFVSMVGGGFGLETGTLDDSSFTDDAIILEDNTTVALEPFSIQLEQSTTDKFVGDGTTTAFTMTNLSASVDTIQVTIDNVPFAETKADGTANWTASGSTLTFTDAPVDKTQIFVYTGVNEFVVLDGTDTDSTDANHRFLTDTVQQVSDYYSTPTDQLVLEFDTFKNISASSTESGSIQKVFINANGGYTDLPTTSVTTTSGTSAKLIPTTTDIGAAKSLKIVDPGFTYVSSNPPEVDVRAHFVVKDVSGTFSSGNTLTTHTGTVKAWNSTTQILDTTFENVIRFEQEQGGTFNEGIQLEQGNRQMLPSAFELETEKDFTDGEDVLLNGTSIFTPSPQTFIYKVRVARNATDTANIFYINDEAQPVLTLYSGNTYYFDLSDSTLYNAVATSLHQLRFSETSDGTHNSGTAHTTGVTTSVTAIDIGTTGAYIQIVVPAGLGQLYYYCVNHPGMGNVAYTPTYQSTVVDAGDNIIFDSTARGPNIALMLLTETGDVGANPTDNVILEDNSGDLHLEETVDGQLQDVGDKLKLNRYRERNDNTFILLDGTDADGTDAGDKLGTEELGDQLILNGTDASSTDAMSQIILSDETGNGQITLDGTDSDSTDAGNHVINQDPIDFSKKNVTITDSSGASATIITADIATATTTADVISTDTGSYAGINSRLGEDLIRIQDSYYYQDYSYEVQVGQSFATYINELKKAVHPAGFQPFGKVTLATLVSAAVGTTGAGLSGYTGDTLTFSPILGSVLETIFSQVLQSRLQVPTTHTADGQVAIGSRDDSIIQEDGSLPGENLVLNGTDGSSTNAGDNILDEDGEAYDLEDGFNAVGDSILFEAATVTSDKDTTSGTGDGAGKFMLETSHATSDKMDRALVTEKVVSVVSNPLPMYETNLLLYLADTPFGNVNGNCGITLESGAGNLTDSLILDGQLPFDEGDTFLVLDGTDASGTDAGDNIKINSSATAPDGNLLGEDGFFAFPLGFRVDIGDRFIFDTNHNDETITLSDIGTLTFENIRRVDRINLSDTNDSLNWGGQDEEDGITMEDFGQIILDGTDSSSTNAGHFLAQETTKRNRFTLEQSGNIIVEEFSTNSNIARFDISDGNNLNTNIIIEDALNPLPPTGIKLEYDDEEGVIVLNGTDSSASDAGDGLIMEDSLRVRDGMVLVLEENKAILSEGQIPLSNFTLNSTSIITKGHVHSAEISVRNTGEIALEDATDTTNSNTDYLLEETSGDNLDLEGATGITY